MTNLRKFWTPYLAAALLIGGVLGFLVAGRAHSQNPREPFRNAVTQRESTIAELREIKSLLKEQNVLLRQMLQQEKPQP